MASPSLPRLDREQAFRVLCLYAKQPTHSKRSRAYEEIDRVVEIASKVTFSRCSSPVMLEDLMQAARLRLFTALPKLAQICCSGRVWSNRAEFYFRLSLSLCRRAMITEYTRLRKQSYGEVPLDFEPDGELYRDLEGDTETENEAWQEGDQYRWEDTQFGEKERVILLNQAVSQTYIHAKRYLLEVIQFSNIRTAAVLTLIGRFDGRTVSAVWLHRAFGVKNHQEISEFVDFSIRKAVNETFAC